MELKDAGINRKIFIHGFKLYLTVKPLDCKVQDTSGSGYDIPVVDLETGDLELYSTYTEITLPKEDKFRQQIQ